MSKADELRANADRADTNGADMYTACIDAAQAAAFKGFYDVSVEVRNTAQVCRVIELLEMPSKGLHVTRTYKGGHTILHLSWRPDHD